jgi:IS30 family transposase
MKQTPYKDKSFLFDMYVKRRMNLTDICKLLKKNYNIVVTPQAVYNWIKKYDLLKYRGKGRNLAATSRRRPKSPQQLEIERRKRLLQKRIRDRKKALGK